jgi:hypothetical protein
VPISRTGGDYLWVLGQPLFTLGPGHGRLVDASWPLPLAGDDVVVLAELRLEVGWRATEPPQTVRESPPTSHTYSKATPPEKPGSVLLKKYGFRASLDSSYPMYSVSVIFDVFDVNALDQVEATLHPLGVTCPWFSPGRTHSPSGPRCQPRDLQLSGAGFGWGNRSRA